MIKINSRYWIYHFTFGVSVADSSCEHAQLRQVTVRLFGHKQQGAAKLKVWIRSKWCLHVLMHVDENQCAYCNHLHFIVCMSSPLSRLRFWLEVLQMSKMCLRDMDCVEGSDVLCLEVSLRHAASAGCHKWTAGSPKPVQLHAAYVDVVWTCEPGACLA